MCREDLIETETDKGEKYLINPLYYPLTAESIGRAYSDGDTAYKECPRAKWEIQEINKIIYAQAGFLGLKETTEPFPEHDCKWCVGNKIMNGPTSKFIPSNYYNEDGGMRSDALRIHKNRI